MNTMKKKRKLHKVHEKKKSFPSEQQNIYPLDYTFIFNLHCNVRYEVRNLSRSAHVMYIFYYT